MIELAEGEPIAARYAVVAAGVWSRELVVLPELRGKVGVSYAWPGQLPEPFIQPYAPYRQVIGFNHRPDSFWIGDGTSALEAGWSSVQEVRSLERCRDTASTALGEHLSATSAEKRVGIRPYMSGVKPCHVETRGRIVIATGGAKNGMLGAGYAAHVIGRELA